MVNVKFALVSLTFFVLLEAYNARHLHGVFMKESFHLRPMSHLAIIQMVTGEETLQLPQSSPWSSSNDQTTYGRIIPPAPLLPKMPPPKGQETYLRVNSPPPPSPDGALSEGQETYDRVKLSSSPPLPNGAPSKGQETNLRVVSPPPPPPEGELPKGQETYGQVNPSSPPPLPNGAPSKGQETYLRVVSPSPPPPDGEPSEGQETYGRINPSPPPLTNGAPSKSQETYLRVESPPPPSPDGELPSSPVNGQETYGQVNPSAAPPPPNGAPSKGQETYLRVESPPPPSPDGEPSSSPPEGLETYGRVNPSPPPPPNDAPPECQTFYQGDKMNINNESYDATLEELEVSPKHDSSMGQTKRGQDDPRAIPNPDRNDSQVPDMYDRVNPSALAITKPTHPLLSDGGSAWTGLSALTIDSRIVSNEDRWYFIAFYRMSSYVTRVIEYWG